MSEPPAPIDRPVRAASPTPVTTRMSHGVLEIVLNRPQARNAMGLAGALAFLTAVTRLNETGAGCLLLRAEGDHFCVGGDLRDFAEAEDVRDRVLRTSSAAHAAVLALAGAQVPVVTAVQGWAAGMGVSLAGLGDIVVAGESARFRSANTAVGFTPDGGLTHLLRGLVGQARAGDFVLTNRTLTAAEAASWGLVSRVVPDADLLDTATTIARQLAAGPRRAQRLTRRLLRSPDLEALRTALDTEAAAISAQVTDVEGREGLAAFLERRDPDFTSP